MQAKSIIRLIMSMAVVFAAAWIGSLAMRGEANGQWYESLKKPFFQPPSWLFGPVWTVLYLLMALSAFLVWQKGFEKTQVRVALFAFLVQLVLNACWTLLFFGVHSIMFALVDIILLWLAIVITIYHFKKVSLLAAILMLPYLVWVTFAAMLNAALFWLNR